MRTAMKEQETCTPCILPSDFTRSPVHLRMARLSFLAPFKEGKAVFLLLHALFAPDPTNL